MPLSKGVQRLSGKIVPLELNAVGAMLDDGLRSFESLANPMNFHQSVHPQGRIPEVVKN
jgi:hypothetical protein